MLRKIAMKFLLITLPGIYLLCSSSDHECGPCVVKDKTLPSDIFGYTYEELEEIISGTWIEDGEKEYQIRINEQRDITYNIPREDPLGCGQEECATYLSVPLLIEHEGEKAFGGMMIDRLNFEKLTTAHMRVQDSSGILEITESSKTITFESGKVWVKKE